MSIEPVEVPESTIQKITSSQAGAYNLTNDEIYALGLLAATQIADNHGLDSIPTMDRQSR